MNLSMWCRILTLSLLFGALSGCDWLSRSAYLAPGQIAEVEKDTTISVLVTDKKTGKRVRSKVKVPGSSGWFVGRAKVGSN